jgi:signal transduction histidine kinase
VEQLLSNEAVVGQAHALEDFEARLVSLEAKVVAVEQRRDQLRLTLEGGGAFLAAVLGGHVQDQNMDVLNPGALVRAVGVASLDYQGGVPTGSPLEVTGGTLVLRDAADLTLLRAAPWWTEQRVNRAMAAAGLILALACLWIFLLRRLLKRETTRLHAAMKVHRDSELEFAATQRERLRLAHDLHDGFQQLLAGAMYRLNAAMTYLPATAPEARNQVQSAQSALQHTQVGLRDAMWGLTDVVEGPPDFTGLLRHAALRMEHWEDIVEVRCTGEQRDISEHLSGSLLMIFQEAVANAIQHGRATFVDVEARFTEAGFALVITDNGGGFDPAQAQGVKEGHLGLSGMADRMRWLGGTFSLKSQPGDGTCVTAFISWARANVLAPTATTTSP